MSAVIPLTGTDAQRISTEVAGYIRPNEIYTTIPQNRLFFQTDVISGGVWHGDVADNAAMLALNHTSVRGCFPLDMCFRLDLGEVFVCITNRGLASTDWQGLGGGGAGGSGRSGGAGRFAADILYVSPSSGGLTATNVQNAIDELQAEINALGRGGGGGGGSGTVTSVGLTVPGMFNLTGSPITGAGTLALSLAPQFPGLFLAGPVSGGSAAPTFRTIDPSEIPAGGVDTEIQFNNAGAFDGNNAFEWDNTNGTLRVGASGLTPINPTLTRAFFAGPANDVVLEWSANFGSPDSGLADWLFTNRAVSSGTTRVAAFQVLTGLTDANTGQISISVKKNASDSGLTEVLNIPNTGAARFTDGLQARYFISNQPDNTNYAAFDWITPSYHYTWVLGGGGSSAPNLFYLYDQIVPAIRMQIDTSGHIRFNAYGAGLLLSDAFGNLTTTTAGTGSFVGPSGGSTDNALLRFDGASGNLGKDSDLIYNQVTGLFKLSSTTPEIGFATGSANINTLSFRTTSPNTDTFLNVLPSGTGSNPSILLYGGSDPDATGTNVLGFGGGFGGAIAGSWNFGSINRAQPTGTGRPISFVLSNSAAGRFETLRLATDGSVQVLNGYIQLNGITPPSATPSGGGWLWVDSGALHYKGPSGTVTTIAVA